MCVRFFCEECVASCLAIRLFPVYHLRSFTGEDKNNSEVEGGCIEESLRGNTGFHGNIRERFVCLFPVTRGRQ